MTIPILVIINLIGLISVKATVLENWATSESRYRYDDHGTQTWSSFENTPHTWSPTLPVSGLQFRVYATNGLDSQNTYVLKFGYLPNPQSITPNTITMRKGGQTASNEEINCSQWGYNNNGYNIVSCTFTPRETYTANESLIITIDYYQGYLTSFRSYMYGFEERLGTNAIITQTGDQIIENQNQNTQEIINNQNENTQIIMEGQKVCTNNIINKSSKVGTDNSILSSTGMATTGNNYFITEPIEINNESTITELYKLNRNNCFYNENMEVITCFNGQNYNVGDTIPIPTNSKYIRFTLYKNNSNTIFNIHKCLNGNQQLNNTLNQDHTYNQENPAHNEQEENETLTGIITEYFEDLETGFEYHITIPTGAAEFIWSIINRITSIEIIRTFIISVLCLGLIKMILNR